MVYKCPTTQPLPPINEKKKEIKSTDTDTKGAGKLEPIESHHPYAEDIYWSPGHFLKGKKPLKYLPLLLTYLSISSPQYW